MKALISFLLFLLSTQVIFSQSCDRVFTTYITYANSELGINYNEQETHNTYRIFQRTNDPSVNTNCDTWDIKKPIIICEGFDIYSDYSTQGIYYDYINKSGYGDLLRSQGYDIITFNITEPTEAIQINALIFSDFINFINHIKQGDQENVVMGVSMGGLIVRYALNHLEKEEIPHNTRLFVSFDAPQQGANVPLSVQALAYDLSVAGSIGAIFGQTDLLYLNLVLNSNGPKQMISDYYTEIRNGASNPHPFHNSFYNELLNMTNGRGYPQNCKKIAIADGSYKADMQEPLNGNVVGRYSGNPAVAFKIKMLGIDYAAWTLRTAPGTDNGAWDGQDVCIFSHWKDCDIKKTDGTSAYALRNNVRPLDHSPGGYYPWFKLTYDNAKSISGVEILWHTNDNACFIPTISALDLNTNDQLLNIGSYSKDQILADSPFDDIWWNPNQGNLGHTYLNPAMGQWLYQQIVNSTENYSAATDKYISDVSVPYSSVYKATNSISFSGVTVGERCSVISATAGNSIHFYPYVGIPSGVNFFAKIEPVNSPKRTLAGNLPQFVPSSLKLISEDNILIIDTLISGVDLQLRVPDKTKSTSYKPTDDILFSSNSISVYPNPAKDKVNILINLKQKTDVGIQLINNMGNVIKTIREEKQDLGIKTFALDLEDLPTGVYILFIKTNYTSFEKKVVISN